MSTKEKLIQRFIRQPKDFTYQELTTLLIGFGYEELTKGKTSGSRVSFFNEEKQHYILIHKPHPSNVIKMYALKYILDELIEIGLIYNKE